MEPKSDHQVEGGGEEKGCMWSDPLPDLAEVEEILGYKFKNKELLEAAFTHSSCRAGTCDPTYERLEYVGDSVLNLMITKEQYYEYPDLPPGILTRLRAANVDTEKLGRVAIKHGLHRYLRHKKPLLQHQIEEFMEEMLEHPLHSHGLIDVPKVLADIVESAMGAVYIDSNSSVDTVWQVFKDLMEPMISLETLRLHPRSELYEVCQKQGLDLKFIDLWKEHTSFDVYIEKIFMGRGSCGLKKEIAQNRAAKVALDNIDRILCLDGLKKEHVEKGNEEDKGCIHFAEMKAEDEEHEEESRSVEVIKPINEEHIKVVNEDEAAFVDIEVVVDEKVKIDEEHGSLPIEAVKPINIGEMVVEEHGFAAIEAVKPINGGKELVDERGNEKHGSTTIVEAVKPMNGKEVERGRGANEVIISEVAHDGMFDSEKNGQQREEEHDHHSKVEIWRGLHEKDANEGLGFDFDFKNLEKITCDYGEESPSHMKKGNELVVV